MAIKNMSEPRLFITTIVLVLFMLVAILATLLQDVVEPVQRPPTVATVDTFYSVLVTGDSTILEAVRAASVQLDSLCLALSQERCLP